MSESKSLTHLIKELLDTGIVIDDGREKIVIATAAAYPRVSHIERARLFTLHVDASGGSRPPARGFSGKEIPSGAAQTILEIVSLHRKGIAKASLAKLIGAEASTLHTHMEKLKSRGKVSESAGAYYPTASTARRRVKGLIKTCVIPRCHNDHYANGLCNNHYNVARREAMRHDSPSGGGESSREHLSYREAILDALREGGQKLTLHELAKRFNRKWQSIRRDIQALVKSGSLVKEGKRYALPSV